MNLSNPSPSYTRKETWWPIKQNTKFSGQPVYQYKKPILKSIVQRSHSEYLSKRTKKAIPFEPLSSIEPGIFDLHNDNKKDKLLSARPAIFIYKKPISDLRQKIYNVYCEHQERNWDGYGAEPMKYLYQSLEFAEGLFSESRVLVESVDIIPENDGCLCFEWFKSNSQFMSISVKEDKLIYNYRIGNEEACGETTFSGKQMLIDQIKRTA